MSKDYYKTLGIEKGASEEEIKKAYRKLAHQHHPDKPGGNEAKFKEINEAFQVLGNQEKRAKFDQYGADFEQQGGFGGAGNWDDFMRAARGHAGQGGGFSFNFGGVDLGDIFGDFFGQGGRGSHGHTRVRGRDIQVDVELTLKDVLTENVRTVRLRKPDACDVCNGTGAEPGSATKKCGDCGGKGYIETIQRTIFGNMRQQEECRKCGGAGETPEKICKHCKGAGALQKESEIQVKIPAGVTDGNMIRAARRGEFVKAGDAGDLYLRVHIKHDKHFERDGNDLYTEKNINFALAALGGDAQIETLEGRITMKIPEGIQSGEAVRLKARGLPYLNGAGSFGGSGHRGDLYVKIIVDTPKKLNKKAKKLLEDLAQEL